jgi:hypothetical protein
MEHSVEAVEIFSTISWERGAVGEGKRKGVKRVWEKRGEEKGRGRRGERAPVSI